MGGRFQYGSFKLKTCQHQRQITHVINMFMLSHFLMSNHELSNVQPLSAMKTLSVTVHTLHEQVL